MDIKQIYIDVLKDIRLMQLATVRDNQPWLSNLWYVMDDNNCVYWISRETRKHSEDIEANPYVAATIHGAHNQGLMLDKGQALVLSGKAERLVGEACRAPYALYAARFPKMPEFQSLDSFLADEGHHYFYKLTPDTIMWWDEVNFPDSPRQEII